MNYHDNVLNDLFPFMLLFFDSRLSEDDAFVRIVSTNFKWIRTEHFMAL